MKKLFLFFTFLIATNYITIASPWRTVLQEYFDKDTILEKGVYEIENNVKVSKSATLTVKAGTKIYFKKGASLIVDGGLFFAGISKGNIEITSEDKENEGYGIIFSGTNPDAEVILNYTNFSYLLVPINFEKNWSRSIVTIENCTFQYIVTGEPSIIINRPDEMAATKEIPFIFSVNNFIYNNSSIYIEGLDSDILNLQFYNNLISSNYYFGYELGGGLYSPIRTTYNNTEFKFKSTFLGNSIYNNYMLNDATDSIIREVNFGIRGRAEKYTLNNNYFGDKTSAEIQRTFDHSINNSGAPFLAVEKPLIIPSTMSHGHIYKVLFNDIEPKLSKRPNLTSDSLKITIYYNRPLQIRQGVQYITYSFFDAGDNKMKHIGLDSKLDVDKENNSIVFTVVDDVYLRQQIGYFTIGGLVDNEGFMIPKVQYGKELFQNKFDRE